MVIDTLCILGYAYAVFKGLKNGLILAVFSLAGFLLAYILSNHFSGSLAKWFTNFSGSKSVWTKAISYIVIFLFVLMIVRLLAGFLQKVAESVSLGLVNRLGGVLFYAASFTVILCFVFSLISLLDDSLTIWAKKSFFYSRFLTFLPYLQERVPVFKADL